MYEQRVPSWEEFNRTLTSDLGRIKPNTDRFSRKLLFRGHGGASWSLATTLERKGDEVRRVMQYYLILAKLKSEAEIFTGKAWQDFDLGEIRAFCAGRESFRVSPIPQYPFMVYLRHHGLPSPLLDWSRSLYVAAFFAFADPSEADVAIYVYWERPRNVKSGWLGDPFIQNYGPNVVAHKRHFLQQAEYTACLRYDDGANQWMFAQHDSVARDPSAVDADQDLLWKYVLPASERRKVLNELNEYNLNAFSLFGSEDSLMHTLWMRYSSASS